MRINLSLPGGIMSNVATCGGAGGGDVILAEIIYEGDIEITSYVNDDVTGVTGNVVFSECTALETISVPSLTTVGGRITVTYNTTLVTVDMSELQTVTEGIQFSNSAALETVTLSALVSVGGNLNFGTSLVETISLPSLETAGDLHVENSNVVTVNLPALTSVTGTLNAGAEYLVTFDAPLLTSTGIASFNDVSATALSLPALVSTNGLQASDNILLTSASFSDLETVTQALYFNNNPSLTSLLLPSLVTAGPGFNGVQIRNNPLLTTLSLPSLLAVGEAFNCQDGAFDQTTVDALLVLLASLDGTGDTTNFQFSTVDFSGGTNAVPSATGLAAKVTLEARFNSVTVNS